MLSPALLLEPAKSIFSSDSGVYCYGDDGYEYVYGCGHGGWTVIKEFEMTDLGILSYFLGMEFVATAKGIFIHQKKYAEDILKRFNMAECNLTATTTETSVKLEKEGTEQLVDATLYKQIVGSMRILLKLTTQGWIC